jgi:galactoside O-acetyltransferase
MEEKMTEQEKMKKGYLWLDDEENMDLQAHTKSLVRKFNTLPPEDMEGREALLKDIFGNVGENVWIVPPLTAAVGKYVSIGEGTYANMNLTLIDDWQITIGKHVLIGPNVTLCTTGHSIHPKHRADGMYSFPITIEDNVWLGANVIVLPGVTIGENSVIGAGSVVTKDIPANVIAFGSPCKVYREINDHDAEYYFRDRRFDEQPE